MPPARQAPATDSEGATPARKAGASESGVLRPNDHEWRVPLPRPPAQAPRLTGEQEAGTSALSLVSADVLFNCLSLKPHYQKITQVTHFFTPLPFLCNVIVETVGLELLFIIITKTWSFLGCLCVSGKEATKT